MIVGHSRLSWRHVARMLPVLLLACMASAVAAAPVGPVQWGATSTVKSGGAAWGRMARLANGDWLAVYTLFTEGAPSRLEIARSHDGARTWAVVGGLARAGRDLDNGELLQLGNGTVLLAMRSVVEGKSYRLPLYRSTDEGAHWRYLSTIDRNESPGGRKDRGVWEPALHILPDGTVSVLYANEKHAVDTPAYNQVISQRLSRDNGASWSAETVAVSETGGGAARPGMPVMARLPHAGYVLAFEICGRGPDCDVSYQRSADGTTWLPGLGTPVAHQRCGPSILATSGGRLLLTSCQNEVSYSDDGGTHWSKAEPAWPTGFRYSWPALYQTGPHEVAIMNGGNDGAIQIRFGTLAVPAPAR